MPTAGSLTAEAPRPTKPLLRGVSHEIASVVALAGWIALASAVPPAARFSVNVYGASLFTLLAVSALYHRPNWTPKARQWMRRLDHAAIFLLIAGTYTPLCRLLDSRAGLPMLYVVWGGAALGLIQSVFWVRAPKPLVAVLYVLLGWAVLPVAPALYRALGGGALALLGLGGVMYSLGAWIYAARKPDPFPKVFGYHEIFHALVIAAAACHFAVVARAVMAAG